MSRRGLAECDLEICGILARKSGVHEAYTEPKSGLSAGLRGATVTMS